MSIVEKTKIIDNIILNSPNRLRDKYFIRYSFDLYNEILLYTKTIDISFKQRVWHWVNNESDYIYCKECNLNRVSFKMNWRDGYKEFCSNKCSSNNKQLRDKTKKTLLEKYGVDHYSKTDDYVRKVKETSLDRYGVDNYSKTEDYVNRSKKTYMDKYGVDSYTKTKEYKEKFKKTCLERYLKDHIFKTDKWRSNFKISKDINYIGYEEGFNLFKCQKNHLFEISTDNYYGRTKNNIELCRHIKNTYQISQNLLAPPTTPSRHP